MTKSQLLIVKLVLISFITIGCSTPSFVFYQSKAGVPQSSIGIKSTFKLIKSIYDELPFAVIASNDSVNQTEIKAYYVLLSPPNNSGTEAFSGISDYIHPLNVMISVDKIKELIKSLDIALDSYDMKQNKKTDGVSYEYTIVNEVNVSKVTKNTEQWTPNFKFILKTFNSESDAFVDLGVFDNGSTKVNYCYYLEKNQVIEFRNRLSKALDLLKDWGMK